MAIILEGKRKELQPPTYRIQATIQSTPDCTFPAAPVRCHRMQGEFPSHSFPILVHLPEIIHQGVEEPVVNHRLGL